MNVLDEVESILYRRAHLYLGEPGPVRKVSLERYGRIAFASLEFDTSTHRIVVKPVAEDARISSPADLYAVHERVRACGASIAGSLPRFLGLDDEHRVMFVEFVPGPTMSEVLRTRERSYANAALDRTARVLANLHRIDGASVGVSRRPLRSNESYVPQFQSLWRGNVLTRRLPADWTFDHLLARLSPGFFHRTGTSLIPVDSQPKNVIVSAGERIVLVDIDYSRGNPAISVAAFLAGIDRLGIRSLSMAAADVESSKRHFLEAYARHAAPEVLEDIVFFYPWCLMQMFQSHAQSRPVFRPYLGRYYGARLLQFLRALEREPAWPLSPAVHEVWCHERA